MPKRLVTAVVLITAMLIYIVPAFYNDIITMDLTLFHYVLLAAYSFIVISFYRFALKDIKDRWK